MAENRQVGGLFCFEVLEQLSDYLDGELSPQAKAKVDAHLAGCAECRAVAADLAKLHADVE